MASDAIKTTDLEAFRIAALKFVARHTATEEAANEAMVALGIQNPDGSLAEAYADDA